MYYCPYKLEKYEVSPENNICPHCHRFHLWDFEWPNRVKKWNGKNIVRFYRKQNMWLEESKYENYIQRQSD